MRYDIYWYEVITSLECLPFENDEKYFLTLWIVEGCNPVRELNNVDDLFSGPSFCAGVISCVETRFASPWADWQTILQELVQDSLGDVLEWYDYNDAMNTWLQNNPFIAAASVTYDNTTSWLVSTDVQGAIDELLASNNIELYEATTDNWIRYTKANGDVIDLKTSHTETITPVPNVATTITHNLWTDRVHVEAYDITTGEKISIQVIKWAGTIDIISTTSDDIEVIIKR